jgi:hypothetical protein
MRSRFHHRLRLFVLLALVAACTGDRDAERSGGGEVSIGYVLMSARPGMTLAEYMALPDSARLDNPTGSDAFGTTGTGVAVQLDLRMSGMKGKSVPLAYSLHDARNNIPFISHTIPIKADAVRWTRQGYVWLPVPSPGTYYVRVMMNDSTGRKTDGPRTEDFTIQ